MAKQLIHAIASWFSKPFPLLEGTTLKLAISFALGITCFLILASFRPFGLHEVEQVTYLAGFGFVAVISLLFHLFLGPFFLPNFFDETKWSIKHQWLLIASITVLISLLNYIYNGTVGRDISPQYGFAPFLYMTSLVGVLPVFIMIYITESVARSRNEILAKGIVLRPLQIAEKQALRISSEGVKTSDLRMSLSDFIYAESDNNYTLVHYEKAGKVETKLMRLKLKSLEDQLAMFSPILRCHKSFVINRNRIISTQGNARSMTVSLDGVNSEIPVSRSFDKGRLLGEKEI